jgi:hypothetical protein
MSAVGSLESGVGCWNVDVGCRKAKYNQPRKGEILVLIEKK